MASSCERANKKLQDDVNLVEAAYEIDLHDALSSVIGHPTSDVMHKKLYSSMYDYLMQSAHLSNFDIDPWDMTKQWQDHFTDAYIDYIGSKTVTHSKRRALGLYNRFKRIKKKRDKILKSKKNKDGMSPTARALLPPSILAMRYDRFGFVSKIVRATKQLTDKAKQSYSGFEAAIVKVKKGYSLNAQSLYDAGLVDKNKIMNGIYGFHDKDENRIIIRERGKTASGYTTFNIEYEAEAPELGTTRRRRKWVAASTLGITDEMYRDAYIKKYMDELMSDLMHGQTRKIMWRDRNTAEGDDWLWIEHELERESKRANTEDVDFFSPDIHVQYHSIEQNGIVVWSGQIKYMMIKQGELGSDKTPSKHPDERYNAYILGTKSDTNEEWSGKNTEESIAVFQSLEDGFYRANGETTHTTRQKKLSLAELKSKQFDKKAWFDEEDHFSDSPFKSYRNFEKLELQPDTRMMEETTPKVAGSKSDYYSLWDVIEQHRAIYDRVGKSVDRFISKNEGKREKFDKLIVSELRKKGMGDEEIEEWFNVNILSVGGIDTKVWKNEQTGDVYTPDGKFEKRSQNYSPVMWGYGEFWDMLDEAYLSVKHKLESGTMTDVQRAEQEELLDALQDMRLYTSGNTDSPIGLIDSARTVHTEQRVAWTSNLIRRRDGQTHVEYLNKTYNNLHRNELVINLMEQMYNTLKLSDKVPSDTIEYMVNRVKLSFGNSDTISKVWTPVGWVRSDNSKIANFMNKLPSFIRGGREWDADTAESLWLTINGVVTSRFLGASGAVGNRSQVANNIVVWGFKYATKARKEMRDNRDYWESIVNNTGVLNLISVFNDIMLEGVEPDTHDYGFYPFSATAMKIGTGAAAPIPSMNMVRFAKLISAGRKKFIDNGEKTIDATILKLLKKEKLGQRQKDLTYLRKLEETINTFNKTGEIDSSKFSETEMNEILEKRGAIYDLLSLQEGEQTEEILKGRFKVLLGDVSEHQLKKMVTWKLTFWWGPGKEIFTFTEGEQDMRFETAVMALMVANDKGILGTSAPTLDRYMSPSAVKIARDAVYGTMFGMSPVFLGEAFAGMGRTIGQYKSYPLFQWIRDYNVWRNFMDTGDGMVDQTGRVLKAFYNSIPKAPGGTPYSVTDEQIDHEAHAMVRMSLIRGMATFLSSMMGILPFVSSLVRFLGSKNAPIGILGSMRSVEDPVFGMMFRMVLWTTMMGIGGFEDDDDEERLRDSWTRQLLMYTTPALFGAFIRDINDWYKKLSD